MDMQPIPARVGNYNLQDYETVQRELYVGRCKEEI